MAENDRRSSKRVEIYDTTLRDGTQGLGFNLSLEDKINIAHELDALGIDYVEGGYPLSNPKDVAFFQEIRKRPLRRAKICAFGMTRRKGTPAADDPGMIALVDSRAPAVALVGKTSAFHVMEVLQVSREENLKMIGESVAFLVARNVEVIYDAEQFFDGFKINTSYALDTLRAAASSGARLLCLCDTNGGTLPEEVQEIIQAVHTALPGIPIGVHFHNDAGLAVANSLAAVKRGAKQVQGTINGVGERCGNVDLIPVIANLALKLGYEVLEGPESLKRLVRVSRFVDEAANLTPQVHQPYVGLAAFTHKGGMHVHAVLKNVSTYEHVPPESVGNTRHMLISELSGTSNVQDKIIKMIGTRSVDRALLKSILDRVMDLENDGYVFETAEASFELIVRKHLGSYRSPFKVQRSLCQSVEDGADGSGHVRAEIEVQVNGKTHKGQMEGLGPIHARLGALVSALGENYPELSGVRIEDFKAYYVHTRRHNGALVRVTLQMCDHDRRWGTVAVSTDLNKAISQCLIEGLEYAILHGEGTRARLSQGETQR